MSMRFLVVLSILSGFHFGSKFGRHSFSVNLFISKVFFSQQELHFCFYDSNNFCLRLTSAMSLHAQVQFHAKYPLFYRQSERGFTLSYAILYKTLSCKFLWQISLPDMVHRVSLSRFNEFNANFAAMFTSQPNSERNIFCT